jgi:hypothetical protein
VVVVVDTVPVIVGNVDGDKDDDDAVAAARARSLGNDFISPHAV